MHFSQNDTSEKNITLEISHLGINRGPRSQMEFTLTQKHFCMGPHEKIGKRTEDWREFCSMVCLCMKGVIGCCVQTGTNLLSCTSLPYKGKPWPGRGSKFSFPVTSIAPGGEIEGEWIY